MAPPLYGLVGSTAMMPTVSPRRRSSSESRSTSVLLPAPGGPVTPTRYARPVAGNSSPTSAAAPGAPSSMSEMARAMARASPARTRAPSGEAAGMMDGPAMARYADAASSWRAMTSRWISLVPSPIVVSLTSRKNFSAG